MDFQNLGRILLVIGIGIAVIGGVLMVIGRLPFFDKLGSLPGDIRIESGSFTCLVPVVSMILLSVVATVVLNIIIRLINRP